MVSKYHSKSKSEPECRGKVVVHTARRSYRFECFGEFFGLDFFPEDQKVVQAITLRGRIRRNKVSVGEPAEGSLLPFIQLVRLRTHYVINIQTQ